MAHFDFAPAEVSSAVVVRFLRSYRGILTQERFVNAGDTVRVEYAYAAEMLNQGAVELVEESDGESVGGE